MAQQVGEGAVEAPIAEAVCDDTVSVVGGSPVDLGFEQVAASVIVAVGCRIGGAVEVGEISRDLLSGQGVIKCFEFFQLPFG